MKWLCEEEILSLQMQYSESLVRNVPSIHERYFELCLVHYSILITTTWLIKKQRQNWLKQLWILRFIPCSTLQGNSITLYYQWILEIMEYIVKLQAKVMEYCVWLKTDNVSESQLCSRKENFWGWSKQVKRRRKWRCVREKSTKQKKQKAA